MWNMGRGWRSGLVSPLQETVTEKERWVTWWTWNTSWVRVRTTVKNGAQETEAMNHPIAELWDGTTAPPGGETARVMSCRVNPRVHSILLGMEPWASPDEWIRTLTRKQTRWIIWTHSVRGALDTVHKVTTISWLSLTGFRCDAWNVGWNWRGPGSRRRTAAGLMTLDTVNGPTKPWANLRDSTFNGAPLRIRSWSLSPFGGDLVGIRGAKQPLPGHPPSSTTPVNRSSSREYHNLFLGRKQRGWKPKTMSKGDSPGADDGSVLWAYDFLLISVLLPE